MEDCQQSLLRRTEAKAVANCVVLRAEVMAAERPHVYSCGISSSAALQRSAMWCSNMGLLAESSALVVHNYKHRVPAGPLALGSCGIISIRFLWDH
jgi:hypothetical protein